MIFQYAQEDNRLVMTTATAYREKPLFILSSITQGWNVQCQGSILGLHTHKALWEQLYLNAP